MIPKAPESCGSNRHPAFGTDAAYVACEVIGAAGATPALESVPSGPSPCNKERCPQKGCECEYGGNQRQWHLHYPICGEGSVCASAYIAGPPWCISVPVFDLHTSAGSPYCQAFAERLPWVTVHPQERANGRRIRRHGEPLQRLDARPLVYAHNHHPARPQKRPAEGQLRAGVQEAVRHPATAHPQHQRRRAQQQRQGRSDSEELAAHGGILPAATPVTSLLGRACEVRIRSMPPA